MVVWTIVDWVRYGKPTLVGLCVGAIAGLATITPLAGFIKPWAALVVGILGSLGCYLACELKNLLKWDDALDVWGVHGKQSCEICDAGSGTRGKSALIAWCRSWRRHRLDIGWCACGRRCWRIWCEW